METDLKNAGYRDEMQEHECLIPIQHDDLEGKKEHHDLEDKELHTDKNYSGEGILEVGRQTRRHHQEFGNRKYKSYRNHSSADDQPQVNTDWSPGRGRSW